MLNVLFQNRELGFPFVGDRCRRIQLAQKLLNYFVFLESFERKISSLSRLLQGGIKNRFFDVRVQVQLALDLLEDWQLRLSRRGFNPLEKFPRLSYDLFSKAQMDPLFTSSEIRLETLVQNHRRKSLSAVCKSKDIQLTEGAYRNQSHSPLTITRVQTDFFDLPPKTLYLTLALAINGPKSIGIKVAKPQCRSLAQLTKRNGKPYSQNQSGYG